MTQTAPTNNQGRLVILWMPIILMGILAAILYAKTIHSPFLLDDMPFILEDHAVWMTDLSTDSIKTALFESKPRRRYLANLSFALNYYFGRDNVEGYHLVNIVIHWLCAVFLFFFIRATLTHTAAGQAEVPQRIPPWMIAFFAAMIWLVSPVHTGAITYIVQRMASLAVLFFILSMWLYILGRLSWQSQRFSLKSTALFAGCAVAGLCAVATKENTGTLPIMILLYEWFFFQDLKFSFKRRHIYWIIGAGIVFAVIALHFLGANPIERILSGYTRRDFTLSQRVMTEWRVIIYYITLLLWPSAGRLNLDHDYPLSYSFVNPSTTFLSPMAITCLVVFAIYTARRHRVVAFCILWFFINLLTESSIIGLEIIFEHRTYMPFMMLCLMAVLFIFNAASRPHVPLAVITIIMVLFSAWTIQRNRVWRDSVVFWSDSVKKSPRDSRPHNNLGYEFLIRRQYDSAIAEFKTAILLDNTLSEAYLNLGKALRETGEIEKSLTFIDIVLKNEPDNFGANREKALIFLQKNQAEIAIQYLKKALANRPYHLEGYFQLGRVLAITGNMDEAIAAYRHVIRFDPDNENAQCNLANLYARTGSVQKAFSHYSSTLAINPHHLEATINLGNLYATQGEHEKAAANFKKALEIDTENTVVYKNLAKIYLQQNRFKKGVAVLKEAEKTAPSGFGDQTADHFWGEENREMKSKRLEEEEEEEDRLAYFCWKDSLKPIH